MEILERLSLHLSFNDENEALEVAKRNEVLKAIGDNNAMVGLQLRKLIHFLVRESQRNDQSVMEFVAQRVNYTLQSDESRTSKGLVDLFPSIYLM